MWNDHRYRYMLEIMTFLQVFWKKLCINANTFLFSPWQKTKLAKVIHWEEKVLVVKGGKRYQPLAFSLNSTFKLKTVAAVSPVNNPVGCNWVQWLFSTGLNFGVWVHVAFELCYTFPFWGKHLVNILLLQYLQGCQQMEYNANIQLLKLCWSYWHSFGHKHSIIYKYSLSNVMLSLNQTINICLWNQKINPFITDCKDLVKKDMSPNKEIGRSFMGATFVLLQTKFTLTPKIATTHI